MTDELRALLRADLLAERPPPLTDLVGAAIRDGRRIRRNRRLATFGAGVVLAGVVAATAAMLGNGGLAAPSRPGVPAGAAPSAAPADAGELTPSALPPGSVPPLAADAMAPPTVRTLTIHSGTQRAVGMPKKATPAAMLHLLTTLVPTGRTSHYGVSADNDLHVQLYVDDGSGPAMVRVSVGQAPAVARRGTARGSTATVTITRTPGDCVQDTVVEATWPDGTKVQVDVATCLAGDGVSNPPAPSALNEKQAIGIAADPRWGVTMDPTLVRLGARQFPGPLPVFG